MIAAFSTELFKKSCKWEEKERSKDAYPGRGGELCLGMQAMPFRHARHWLMPLHSGRIDPNIQIISQKMKNEFWQISWYQHEEEILSWRMVDLFSRSAGRDL